jgi:hydrogenase maturation protein HypF
LREEVHYEGQAAIELEAQVDADERGAYAFEIEKDTFEAGPVIEAALADWGAGVPIGQIAARFHNGLAALVMELCDQIREETQLNIVALSGGVWQNQRLLEAARAGLLEAGFNVLAHQQVPTNDGGVSLGQAAVAAHLLDV